jgi:hypothetical protein
MNTLSARVEYTMFAPAQPNKQGDLDSNVTGEVGRDYYTGVDLLLI